MKAKKSKRRNSARRPPDHAIFRSEQSSPPALCPAGRYDRVRGGWDQKAADAWRNNRDINNHLETRPETCLHGTVSVPSVIQPAAVVRRALQIFDLIKNLERARRIERPTLTLARLCSTPELRPRSKWTVVMTNPPGRVNSLGISRFPAGCDGEMATGALRVDRGFRCLVIQAGKPPQLIMLIII